MTTTETTPAIDPVKAYDALNKAMRANPEFGRRVNAHIQATTGHANVDGFMANGSTDDEKVTVLRHCLQVWRSNDYTQLLTAPATPPEETEAGDDMDDMEQGEEGEGEAEEVEEIDTEAETKVLVGDRIFNALKEGREQAKATEETPVAPPTRPKANDAAQRLLEALNAAMPTPALDEEQVNHMVNLAVSTRISPVNLRVTSIEQTLQKMAVDIQAILSNAKTDIPTAVREAVQEALLSATGKRITDGLASGELELLPVQLPCDPTYVQSEVGIIVERAIRLQHHVIVSGPSGSGKTFPIEMELRKAGKSYIGPISVGSGMTKKDLRARESLKAGEKGVETKWIYGFLVRAMQLGVAVIFDEISQMEKETLSHIFYAMEYKRLHLEETGETITAKPGFHVFGTDNALTDMTGLYSGYGLSAALTNRFRFVYADYMDAKSEISIFEKHGVSRSRATQIRAFLDEIRKAYHSRTIEFAPSTRTGKALASELADGQPVERAVRYCIADGLKPVESTVILTAAKAAFN